MVRKKLSLTLTSPLTAAEKKRFGQIERYVNAGGRLALIRTALDGKPCAVIAMAHEQDDDTIMYPVAMLLLDEDFDRLADPTEDAGGK